QEEPCATGPCCRRCKFKRAGKVCRVARGDWNDDYCTGKSCDCPKNPWNG
uniref:Disintegrin eristostatin n=1 Tax=Eristicophis macmahoni TaxID=110227 RepID=VM2TO_ERIMA|nr:RecName: Full=Disintegrin eristostatin [Eristicophis macmahoni]